ncbi:MAG: pitrilysin family protein [Candidatus Zixiibacteriota bacterium]
MVKGRRTANTDRYRKAVLPDGLRVVTEFMPSVRSISLGVWVDVGSRHEPAPLNGVSHFIEHMLFKGTHRRTARELAAALESLGGSLNGFTSREHTCFTARFLDEHLETAVDVLSDMTCHATLAPSHIRMEKKVICEEIKEVEDTPSDHIHDLFSETFWGDHPLGRSILGSAKTVTGLTRKGIVDYLSRGYRAGSIVVAAAGRVNHARLVRLVKEYFEFAQGVAESALPAGRSLQRNVRIHTDGNSQTHLCLGFPGLSFTDPDKMAALALNAHLGAGMSSVLFQKIREERGLAYSVYTFHDLYCDAGVVGAYLGTDRRHVRQAVEIILKEFEALKRRRLPSAKLDQVKSQMKGQLALSMESTTGRMNRLARQELMNQPYRSHRQMLNAVDRVSTSQLMEMANRLFDRSRIAVAVLGPVDKGGLDNVV